MDAIFNVIDIIVAIIGPLSDFLWEFPTNFEWYANIPVLGEFSFSTILLVGSGIYFTFRLKGIQVTLFQRGLRVMTKSYKTKYGISPLAAFLLSSGIRVGPGNILGVTGAIATGGPGALFWMWVSAFFGMATAYTESTLAQIFKERRGTEYVGGLPYYAKTLCHDRVWVGILAAGAYILYSVCGIPVDSFNTVTGIAAVGRLVTGVNFPVQSEFYYYVSAFVVALVAFMAFGGVKRVTKACEFMVPIMACVYFATVIALVLYNADSVSYFFHAVFAGAFTPDAMFGGAFGVMLVQGVKRGLMSNEAGQGTITMAAGASDAKHPCEQGLIGAIGVFFDTHIICTLTGFIIIMAHRWTENFAAFQSEETYSKFLNSVSALTPGFMESIILLLISVCFALFAYTSVIGMVAFSEVSAKRISDHKWFIQLVRFMCVVLSAFGIMSSIAGYDLSRMWAFEDLGNITIVYVNILMLYLGFKYVIKATNHYKKKEEATFSSMDVIGIDTPCWKNKE